MEAAHYIATHSLLTLSPQELVDYDFESNGCEYGSVANALTYIWRFGVGLDAHYPYIASQQVRKNDVSNPCTLLILLIVVNFF